MIFYFYKYLNSINQKLLESEFKTKQPFQLNWPKIENKNRRKNFRMLILAHNIELNKNKN